MNKIKSKCAFASNKSRALIGIPESLVDCNAALHILVKKPPTFPLQLNNEIHANLYRCHKVSHEVPQALELYLVAFWLEF